MSYKNGNYCAFYVNEPFDTSNLGASSTKNFVYYRMLQAWKELDEQFPFNDSHNKTYNVHDDSNWETTLKPRLKKRLDNSKNIILFLSSTTKNSKALKEEIKDLWDNLPIFRDSANKVPVLHIPLNKDSIKKALNNNNFMFNSKRTAGDYLYRE